jgi:hypothetical protein
MMYANATEVPWTTARMAESFGLNSNQKKSAAPAPSTLKITLGFK